MLLRKEREQIVEYGKKLVETGLVVGTFGNISLYNPEKNLMAISPSGMDYFKVTPEDIVILTPDGEVVEGSNKPSSELDMHRIFYLKRKGINAVVHTHSRFATTLACMNLSIPPLHYLVAYAGKEVPCTPYVQFGSWELAEEVHKTMGDNYACLLGNHGLLAVGNNLQYAFDVAEQIEFVSELYCRTLSIDKPKLLSDEQITSVLEAFKTYRKK
ncbi:MAG: L-fuculose-phosphate aldolase [Tyzzerella sp.]|uniref:L-fuculose-phosphate aldolase n=1 Tax=Candidatus Fimicola merdigallinarum TaxID=2840819 RepID=A0A9D9E1K7_9FIRM|nr:L-fuculose-phosphate aldolase [Candidatus Fimicola merdigallinarum]